MTRCKSVSAAASADHVPEWTVLRSRIQKAAVKAGLFERFSAQRIACLYFYVTEPMLPETKPSMRLACFLSRLSGDLIADDSKGHPVAWERRNAWRQELIACKQGRQLLALMAEYLIRIFAESLAVAAKETLDFAAKAREICASPTEQELTEMYLEQGGLPYVHATDTKSAAKAVAKKLREWGLRPDCKFLDTFEAARTAVLKRRAARGPAADEAVSSRVWAKLLQTEARKLGTALDPNYLSEAGSF